MRVAANAALKGPLFHGTRGAWAISKGCSSSQSQHA